MPGEQDFGQEITRTQYDQQEPLYPRIEVQPPIPTTQQPGNRRVEQNPQTGQGQPQWYPPGMGGGQPVDGAPVTGRGNPYVNNGGVAPPNDGSVPPAPNQQYPPTQQYPAESQVASGNRRPRTSSSSGGTFKDAGVFATGLYGGLGAYLGAGPVHQLSHNFADGVANGNLGARSFGPDTMWQKNFPQLNKQFNSAATWLDDLGNKEAAKTAGGWIQRTIKPYVAPEIAAVAPEAAATTAGGAATSTAQAAEGLAGWKTTAGNILSKPGTQNFLKGFGLAGGVILADNILPVGSDDYHLSSLGVPLALAMPGSWKSKAAVGFGSLAAGRLINGVISAEDHPHLAHIMKPNLMDTAVMTGALFLPMQDPKLKMGAVGGAWVFGRMTGMNHLEAGGTSAALGFGTWKMTKNPYLAATVGVSSFVGSRIFQR